MSYAFSYEVPASEEMYRQVNQAIGAEPPPGLVAHLVVKADGGLRHIEVWDSKDDWDRFHDERVEPALRHVLTAAGFAKMPPDPPLEELALVDVWLGSQPARR
jgi:hypothetical protein